MSKFGLVKIKGNFKLRDQSQTVDNAIHRINHYLVDSAVCFVYTYQLDSDLSGEKRYPAFKQLRPGV